MLNILPTEEKKKILVEYRLRLGVVSVFALGALVFSSLILLAPSYMLAVVKHNSISEELSALELKQSNAGQEKEVGVQIRDENKKIDLFLKGLKPDLQVRPTADGGLGDTGGRLSPPQAIMSILGIKGDAVKIQGFTYDASALQERFVVTGVAADREGLAHFVEILKKDPTFTKVELPISSYVKSSNIDFSIVVERATKVVPVKK